jgi:cytochrome c oxidase subunit 2
MKSLLPEIPLLPTNAAGESGEMVDGLLHLVTYIITPWTLLTFGVILLFCIIYRRRENRSGEYVDSHQTLFEVWGIPIPRTAIIEVPTILVLGLDLWIFFSSVVVWGDLKINKPDTDTTIQVVGKQFGWDFYYPGPNDQLDTSIERKIRRGIVQGKVRSRRVVNVNEGDDVKHGGLVVPAGKQIGLKIASEDVIHSLFIPNMRFKQDAVPGRNIDAWIKAAKPTRPTYLEDQILSELNSVISVAEDQFSGDASEQRIETMREHKQAIVSSFEVKGSVPDYANLEQDHYGPLHQGASALQGEGTEKISQHLKKTRSLFSKIQSNERPYYEHEAYTIACAELCGTGHSGMVAEMRVLPKDVMEETFQRLKKGDLNYGQYFQ